MIDKSTVKSSFSKRADTYDKFASFQKEIANLLLSEIYKRDFFPKNILDIGSGTGNISINLAENYKFSKIVACDIAHGMSVFAQGKIYGQSNIHIATADTETLPYPQEFFDLVISSLMFQWVYDLRSAFTELYRVVKGNGYIYLTTLGEGSLNELKDSFESALSLIPHCSQAEAWEREGGFQRFNNSGELKSLMASVGFRDLYAEIRDEVRHYPDVETFLKILKYIGANQSNFAKNNGMGIKNVIKEMIGIYRDKYKTSQGIRATYQVILLKGRK